MAKLEDGKGTSGFIASDPTKSLRTNIVPRSLKNFLVTGNTGTIAAALAANSSVFAMRLSPAAGSTIAFIERIRIQFTTIVAFTTPITAGRILALYRGTGAAASGGSALTVKGKNSLVASGSLVTTGGDARISTTGALTVTGITYESTALQQFSLVHLGTAGAHYEWLLEFASTGSAPLAITAGEVLAIRNPTIFDAAGTWQANITVHWHEASAYDATADA